MNVVLDDAEELSIKKKTRKALGRILLKGDNITLMMNTCAAHPHCRRSGESVAAAAALMTTPSSRFERPFCSPSSALPRFATGAREPAVSARRQLHCSLGHKRAAVTGRAVATASTRGFACLELPRHDQLAPTPPQQHTTFAQLIRKAHHRSATIALLLEIFWT